MASQFGNLLKISLFGESHGSAVGVLLDGLPAGEAIDLEALQKFLDRRRPGKDFLSTARCEPDRPRFLSGTAAGPTQPALRRHRQQRRALLITRRWLISHGGHADYTAYVRWRGRPTGAAGIFGRLTAPSVWRGIVKRILARRGIHIGAHLASVAGICDEPFPPVPTAELFEAISTKAFPVIDGQKGRQMQKKIAEAAAQGDSVGGVIECAAIGVPAGLGSPHFDGVENRLAAALFGIPAVKGLEYGAGFESAALRGSQNNDPFVIDKGGAVRTATNNCGGILGGITNGMPLLLRAAVKPTPVHRHGPADRESLPPRSYRGSSEGAP